MAMLCAGREWLRERFVRDVDICRLLPEIVAWAMTPSMREVAAAEWLRSAEANARVEALDVGRPTWWRKLLGWIGVVESHASVVRDA
jgi:hypothetical protein